VKVASTWPGRKVQRTHHYALVDEADNIFVDEARTPLVISTGTRLATPEEQVVFVWSDGLAKQTIQSPLFVFVLLKSFAPDLRVDSASCL
jgi:hypothetical protein